MGDMGSELADRCSTYTAVSYRIRIEHCSESVLPTPMTVQRITHFAPSNHLSMPLLRLLSYLISQHFNLHTVAWLSPNSNINIMSRHHHPNRIAALSDSICLQLRAGPAAVDISQCVEELVLNSIDANADKINIEVREPTAANFYSNTS